MDAAYCYRRHTSVCLCALGTRVSCAKRLEWSRCHLEAQTRVGSRNVVSDGSRSFHGMRHFTWDMFRPIVTYVRMSVFRIVRLPPLANVPAKRTPQTNAFAAATGDKRAMRPFVKLLGNFGQLLIMIAVFIRFSMSTCEQRMIAVLAADRSVRGDQRPQSAWSGGIAAGRRNTGRLEEVVAGADSPALGQLPSTSVRLRAPDYQPPRRHQGLGRLHPSYQPDRTSRSRRQGQHRRLTCKNSNNLQCLTHDTIRYSRFTCAQKLTRWSA